MTTITNSQYVIELWQVALALHDFNIHKASGPDLVVNWLLKEFASSLAEPVCAIFLTQRTFPQLWKSAEVIPMPKVNPPRSIETDLRPISLSPTLAKVFYPLLDAGFLTLYCLQLILTNLELFAVDPKVMPWSQFCTNDALLSMLGVSSELCSLILPRHSIGWIIIYSHRKSHTGFSLVPKLMILK